MKGINTFTLKMIAVAAMLIDHVGAVLLPQFEILRIIGRLAFPIYAYTLVQGFQYTRNLKKYLLRLGALALISEIPFDLAFFRTIFEPGHQNVFFTLFLGILMLALMTGTSSKVKQMLCVLGIMVLSELLCTDYSSMGILMIFWFYQNRNQNVMQYIGITVINVFLMGGTQMYAALALIPIYFHNRKEGPKSKLFFYGFYPIHLIGLYLISLLR